MQSRQAPHGTVADALPDNWVDRILPGKWRPFARLLRLDRPIGWWLLLLPCLWSLALATRVSGGGIPSLWFAALFTIGAIIMRGAGCTLNDIVDRNLDARVERTRSRPLPAGQVTVLGALVFLAVLCFAGLVVLLQFNDYTIVLGATSLVVVAIYPFMKRITDWPQLVLGIAFNWGALVGWSAVMGSLAAPPLLLYAGGIAWTLAYDTIYAQQDKEDDALIGVRSTALKLGSSSVTWIAVFFAAGLVLIDAGLWLAGAGLLAHVGVAGAAMHAAWQVARLDTTDPQRCLMLFRSNRDFGLLILAGITLDSLLT
jgi:4-hydroxybenzoate polyprenyltransferase